ncbi:MAG: hypothetical protein LBB78_03445 [Spirochaetaceae bacterium]|nr:hypothetical protein [Spirochaetaceae bacterium]
MINKRHAKACVDKGHDRLALSLSSAIDLRPTAGQRLPIPRLLPRLSRAGILRIPG